MASIDENINTWNDPSVWALFKQGESWSEWFGSTEILWNSFLYPRIYKFFENKDVLEIAPGTGRLTQYLLRSAKNYVGYDLSEYCINYCKNKFKNNSFLLNDGLSLTETPDSSVDFIFSWDSLVHADKDVLFSYASESLRCLRDNGIAFIHHSNLNKSSFIGENIHWRGDLSGEDLKAYIEQNGGSVLIQEMIPWDDSLGEYSDCITIFSRKRDLPFVGLNRPMFGIVRQENNRVLSQYESLHNL
jgi:SAM-dependent methyltransferase